MTHQGTVKFFDQEKGFGFILINGTGPDVFVHLTGVDQVNSGSLQVGDQVQFDIEYDHRKDKEQAVNVIGGTGKNVTIRDQTRYFTDASGNTYGGNAYGIGQSYY